MADSATPENLVFPVGWRKGRYRMGRTDDMLGLPELLETAKCHPIDRCWHALRHSFASHAAMSGMGIITLKELLGHSDIAMTMRYAHLLPDHKAAEIARMSFAVAVAGVESLEEARWRRELDTSGISDATIAANVS